MAGFGKVLYFIDEEDETSDAMRLAIARAPSLGAALTFVSVVAPCGTRLLGGRIPAKRL